MANRGLKQQAGGVTPARHAANDDTTLRHAGDAGLLQYGSPANDILIEYALTTMKYERTRVRHYHPPPPAKIDHAREVATDIADAGRRSRNSSGDERARGSSTTGVPSRE